MADGAGILPVPSHIAALSVGSNLRGTESFGGEIEDVYCFSRPLKMGFHYTPFKEMAALGPISAEEMAYRDELREKRKAAQALKAKEEEESGGGMMLRMAGPANTCVTNGPVYLTNVVCSFTTNEGWSLAFDIAGGTNGVIYDLFSTPTLKSNSVWTWLETAQTCETHYFTNQATNQMFYTILTPGMDRDADGMYDGWELKHFGTLEQTAGGDYDGNGTTNRAAFSNNDDPNQIKFSVGFGAGFVNGNTAAGSVFVWQGVPDQVAVLVNTTNFDSAMWFPFQSNIVANIGNTDGEYVVWLGLRGHSSDTRQEWQGTTVIRDSVAPVMTITNPASGVVSTPVIQVQGFANEPLLFIHYDITNATGLETNIAGFVTGQFLNTNSLRFTTNWFQCYDVELGTNLNTLTVRVSDLAGNMTTTSLSVTLDLSNDTNAPVISLTWPPDNALLSGGSFTLRGQLNDSSASVNVAVGSNAIAGKVDRNGGFEVAGIPITAATNVLSVVATDAAGNQGATTRTVRQSSETLTMNAVNPSDLTQPTVTLGGTVGTSGQNVWVNGIAATVTGNAWTAEVPTPQGGVANFTVQTGSSLASPTGALNVSEEVPPKLRVVSFTDDIRFNRNGNETERRLRTWGQGVGGASRRSYNAISDPQLNCATEVIWPGEWPNGSNYVGSISCSVDPYEETSVLSWQNADTRRSQTSCYHHPELPGGYGCFTYTGERKTRTDLELQVGGKPERGVNRLVRLTVQASGFPEEWTIQGPNAALWNHSFYFPEPGTLTIPPGDIRLFGLTPTPTTTNANVGEVFVTFPAGSETNFTIHVTSSKNYSFDVKAQEVKASILVDANRDGSINEQDKSAILASKPFRFWINDDTDDGDTTGDDIPGQWDIDDPLMNLPLFADYRTAVGGNDHGLGVVDGTRDLVDFFPVYLDITNLLTLLPPSATVTYKLKHQGDAVNVVFTVLNRANALDYQTDYDLAQSVVSLNTRKVTSVGLEIPPDFLTGIANGTNGVISVEGRSTTTRPLRLVVEKQGVPVVELALPLRIGGVELMFRHLNLNYVASGENNEVPSRASAPNEPPTNGKNFVFMHGYNVNQQQARGWAAEIYKRMYWGGSRARFYAVSWYAYESQVFQAVSYNLQTNIVHAFETAPYLASFLNTLPGETVIAGHSLGNMLASAAVTRFGGTPAKYFIIDGAVAMEAFDPEIATQVDMVNQHWNDYYLGFPAPDDDYLFASEWYQLFPANDPRSHLTWRGVFTNWGSTVVYNFYSSGEQVMKNIPAANGNNFGISDAANFPWGCQEKLKGRMPVELLGSTVGGWAFNQLDYGTNVPSGDPQVPDTWIPPTPASARSTPTNQLVTLPFFKKSPAGLFSTNATTAQNFAQQNFYDLLARAIPSRTFGVGANPMPVGKGFAPSTDMQFLQKTLPTGWPSSRGQDFNWRHSDLNNVAYLFTHKCFDEMINLGKLK